MRLINCTSMTGAGRIYVHHFEFAPALVPAEFGADVLDPPLIGPLFQNQDRARDFLRKHGDPESTYYFMPLEAGV